MAHEALELWLRTLKIRVDGVIDQIPKEEIQEGLWGPDAVVYLLEEAVREHLQGADMDNPAMATVVERDRLRGSRE